jgi:hypothetical protein
VAVTSSASAVLQATGERRTHDYVRHGTTNLYAALDPAAEKRRS